MLKWKSVESNVKISSMNVDVSDSDPIRHIYEQALPYAMQQVRWITAFFSNLKKILTIKRKKETARAWHT